jgi:hypothetical protein
MIRVPVLPGRPALARAHVLACTLALGACKAGDATTTDTASTSTTSTSTSTSTSTTTTASTGPDTPTTTSNDGLPPTPTLVSPQDGATDVPLETALCWNLVEDPEGEQLRYRVFVNDAELTEGELGDFYGHDGPCTAPLTFSFERTYTWRVQAFEVADPTRSSPMSETWSFATVHDGLSQTVFADNFDEDLGWEVLGDAASGAWTRGDPVLAQNAGKVSQPDHCLGGTNCFFTGQNPDGLPAEQDVAGGSTILLSPAFDLGGAAAATVQLGRFFYKSAADPGPRLVVELLVPGLAPGEYDAYPLELLAQPTTQGPENLWLPREYAVCGPPLVKDSRLRITATDAGAGLLEAAIDSVKVRAHDDATVCGAGLGGACDPTAPAACPGDLLCCSQGVINEGVNRCTTPVRGLDFAAPPPNPEDPGNGPLGCDAPDLVVDGKWLDTIFTDIMVSPATCELAEGCVGGIGWRSLMLFTVATPNIGSTDLVMGIPANHPDLYHYSDCHAHFHFDEFARYELRDGATLAATGHKQAFCMLDTASWAWPNAPTRFTCENQGISRGFTDFYESGLPCQWIDITGVPPGEYTLKITLNQPRQDSALPLLNERDYSNNVFEVAVVLP